MISVRRPAEAPKCLDHSVPDSRASKELRAATTYYAVCPLPPKGYPHDVYKDDSVVAALGTLFHNKCAYCESRYQHVHPMDVEHFRPKSGVMVNGKLERPGYYWLAGEWTNLLPSCIHCNRESYHLQFEEKDPEKSGKANWFPLPSGQKHARAPADVAQETPLLLNPCEDDPNQHLSFEEDGRVRGLANDGTTPSERGSTSIEVFGLMRIELVAERKERAILIRSTIRRIQRVERQSASDPSLLDDVELLTEYEDDVTALKTYVAATAPYAGMARQILERVAPELSERLADSASASIPKKRGASAVRAQPANSGASGLAKSSR
jgi:uncharacterized protein (TIGR02646 family)